MLLLIDNYDSFTYNLFQYLSELGAEVRVVRNDAMTAEQIEELAPDRIVISPGPGNPDDAGVSCEVIGRLAGRVPILGVCLGHQCIGAAFGATVVGAGEIRHGKLSSIEHDGHGVFAGLPNPFDAIRYHSLAVTPSSVPAELEISARSEHGVVMGLRHRRFAVEGIQFHPESIMTEPGKDLLRNFLAMQENGEMMKEALDALVNQRRDLTEDEAAAAMTLLMEGDATPSQIGAFLTALRLKGETVDEIAGMARVMREKALKVPAAVRVIDTCGTGGDGSGTFNVSTAAAFVAAAAGIPVAKHGNRAASSRCGSADVLEALGAQIELTPDQVAVCIAESGIGFMFAPAFHPAMRHAAAARRELGFRTIFNILGPLTNPAGAAGQVLGVPTDDLVEKIAQALGRLGVQHVLVVHSQDGLDEISLAAPTHICEITAGEARSYTVTPEQLGLQAAPRAAVLGGDPSQNAKAMRSVLAGTEGPMLDFTILNAAAALVVGNVASSLEDGVSRARDLLKTGGPTRVLDSFVAATQRLGAVKESV